MFDSISALRDAPPQVPMKWGKRREKWDFRPVRPVRFGGRRDAADAQGLRRAIRPPSKRSCAFRLGLFGAFRVQIAGSSRPAAMPRIEIDLPQVVSDAFCDAAAAAGIPPAELLAEALRCIPAFQRALAARPERLPAFANSPRS